MEEWKQIEGYEDYQISDKGRLKGYHGKISEGWNVNGTYKKVRLYKSGISKDHYVHRLVALYFVSNPGRKHFVNHIDFNPSNNQKENLEWCTHQENMSHSASKNRMSNGGRTVVNIKTGEKFKSIKEAAESIGINQNTLVYALRRGSKKHPFICTTVQRMAAKYS